MTYNTLCPAFLLSTPLPISRTHSKSHPLSRRTSPRSVQTLKTPKQNLPSPIKLPSTPPRPRRKLGPKKPKATPHLAAVGDDLQETPRQTLLVAIFGLAALAAPPLFISSASTLAEVLLDLVVIPTAFILADFLVGVYHHAVDNYGSEHTPVFGCKSLLSLLPTTSITPQT